MVESKDEKEIRVSGLSPDDPIILPSAVDERIIKRGQKPQRLAGLVHDLRTRQPLQYTRPGLWVRENEVFALRPMEEHELITSKSGERVALKRQGLDRVLNALGAEEILNSQVQRILKTVGKIEGIEGTYHEIASQLRELGGTLKDFMADGSIETLEPKGFDCIVGFRWFDTDGVPHQASFRSSVEAKSEKQVEGDLKMTAETKARNRAARFIGGLGYLHKWYVNKVVYIKVGHWIQVSNSAQDVAAYLSNGEVKMIEALDDSIRAEEDMALWGAEIDYPQIEELTSKKEAILNNLKKIEPLKTKEKSFLEKIYESGVGESALADIALAEFNKDFRDLDMIEQAKFLEILAENK